MDYGKIFLRDIFIVCNVRSPMVFNMNERNTMSKNGPFKCHVESQTYDKNKCNCKIIMENNSETFQEM